MRITERVQEFEPSLISYAAGDRLVYRDFYYRLRDLPKRCYVNLITSGYFLKKDLYALIATRSAHVRVA